LRGGKGSEAGQNNGGKWEACHKKSLSPSFFGSFRINLQFRASEAAQDLTAGAAIGYYNCARRASLRDNTATHNGV